MLHNTYDFDHHSSSSLTSKRPHHCPLVLSQRLPDNEYHSEDMRQMPQGSNKRLPQALRQMPKPMVLRPRLPEGGLESPQDLWLFPAEQCADQASSPHKFQAHVQRRWRFLEEYLFRQLSTSILREGCFPPTD